MDRFWEYYGRLGAFREQPSEQRASELRAAFTDLFSTRTGYDQLDKRIAITAAKQVDLLTVLDHPSCPLHNNASELGARVSARRRDVSLHGRSPRGAHSMDVFTTIVQSFIRRKLAQAVLVDFLRHVSGVQWYLIIWKC